MKHDAIRFPLIMSMKVYPSSCINRLPLQIINCCFSMKYWRNWWHITVDWGVSQKSSQIHSSLSSMLKNVRKTKHDIFCHHLFRSNIGNIHYLLPQGSCSSRNQSVTQTFLCSRLARFVISLNRNSEVNRAINVQKSVNSFPSFLARVFNETKKQNYLFCQTL